MLISNTKFRFEQRIFIAPFLPKKDLQIVSPKTMYLGRDTTIVFVNWTKQYYCQVEHFI